MTAVRGKMTVLDIVQNILSAMDSDEVNSISDTIESLQVAEEVKATYYDILAGLDEPHRQGSFQLLGLGDTTKPNYLKLPDTVRDVTEVYYNQRS
jgi:hypothetical protein